MKFSLLALTKVISIVLRQVNRFFMFYKMLIVGIGTPIFLKPTKVSSS
ncbi:hypothetical protein FlaCF_2778 [Flavobacterium tructae]